MVLTTGTGKSAILERYTNDSFNPNYIPTIGIDFRIKRTNIASTDVKLQIWDTAGQRRFRTITSAYFRGAMTIYIIYDVSDMSTFNSVKDYWMSEVRQYSVGNGSNSFPLYLIGNKCDVETTRVSRTTMSFKNLFDFHYP